MYFALTAGSSSQRWQTSKGEPTAGIYGFARELLRIFEQEKPDYLAVAFDTGKTFRDTIFPEYKATRAKMPDDLRPQIERIRQMVDAFNIPRLEMEGFEADDVLGSAAHWAARQGLGVKIITGDRDLLQLVDARIMFTWPATTRTILLPKMWSINFMFVLSRWWITRRWSETSRITYRVCLAWVRKQLKISCRNTERWITSTLTLTR